jgi:ribosomal protein S18 acetylase RimI-like enzyme
MPAEIRPYASGDLDALYDVCLRTAADGGDASDEYSDPALPGHLYAGPYGVLEPEMAFVAADSGGVCGYVVGAADTASFEDRCEAEWFPELRARFPEGSGTTTRDRRIISQFHHPRRQDEAITACHPAHLHINLLPRLQGQGIGRALIERFSDNVRRAAAAGIHLGVSQTNQRALAFYRRVGFVELRTDPGSIWLGRRLAE